MSQTKAKYIYKNTKYPAHKVEIIMFDIHSSIFSYANKENMTLGGKIKSVETYTEMIHDRISR